jgi:hypothetical protein
MTVFGTVRDSRDGARCRQHPCRHSEDSQTDCHELPFHPLFHRTDFTSLRLRVTFPHTGPIEPSTA